MSFKHETNLDKKWTLNLAKQTLNQALLFIRYSSIIANDFHVDGNAGKFCVDKNIIKI